MQRFGGEDDSVIVSSVSEEADERGSVEYLAERISRIDAAIECFTRQPGLGSRADVLAMLLRHRREAADHLRRLVH